MSNRILAGIEKYKSILKEKNFPSEKIESLSKGLDMEFLEYCRFQELKSAVTGSRLSLDESMTIYGFLGNTPDHFNKQLVEVQAVLT